MHGGIAGGPAPEGVGYFQAFLWNSDEEGWATSLADKDAPPYEAREEARELGGGGAVGLDVGGDGVDGGEGVFGYVGVGDGDAELFFEGDDELEGVDGVEAEAIGAEEGEVVGDLLAGGAEHEVFDHHVLDGLFQGLAGHGGEEVNRLKRGAAQAII